MKIVYNNWIPFKGFMAINLFNICFVRNECMYKMNDIAINHESIHSAQQKELLYIFFYILYIFEWIMKLCCYGDMKTAYMNISFEREAYMYEDDLLYLINRRHYRWLRMI